VATPGSLTVFDADERARIGGRLLQRITEDLRAADLLGADQKVSFAGRAFLGSRGGNVAQREAPIGPILGSAGPILGSVLGRFDFRNGVAQRYGSEGLLVRIGAMR